MGNDNSQITFPIEGNNHQNKIQFNSKKLKHKKESSNNNQIQINHKSKNYKNQKTTKNYIVPRISTTPDRNIIIPGMNKNPSNTKRYVSYEKPLKAMQNTENKNMIKKKEINNEKKRNKIWNSKSIINITNLLNSIYSCEIDKKFDKVNELHLGINNQIDKNINFMFDAIFRYNYFFKHQIKPIKIKSNSKNKNDKNNSHSPSPKQNENNTHIKNINNYNIINKNMINNNKYLKSTPPKINGTINTISNTDIKRVNQNTTLVLNKYDLEDEVISVNNKKKNNYNHINYNPNIPNKKYSESRYITDKADSESAFISQEETSLMNNIAKIKTKEEDASESQTDKQEMINHNLMNKNKINNNNYFKENSRANSNKNNIIINNEKKPDNKNETKNYKNLKINTDDSIKSKFMDKDEEIILSNSESQNTTYLDILLTMNENKNESIINNIKTEYYNNKSKKFKKISNNKINENKKQITPPNIPIRREITPPNISNKRLTLNMPLNKIPKNNMKTINNENIINKCKKITPTKKMQINININANGTKKNFYQKQYSINNNINNSNKNVNIINTNNTMNINNVYSPKKITKNSLSKNKINNSNLSSKKTLENKIPNNFNTNANNNNNYPIFTYTNSINRIQCINNIKNKKNSESISPTNSKNPSPTNHINNNNYKDKYVLKKTAQMNNNSIHKKVIDMNNISNQHSTNASNNNYIHNIDKSSTLYSRINTNNTTKRTNYNNMNNKKIFRNSANRNKIIFFKKERLSGNSFNNKIQNNNTNEAVEVEQRTKSNDQKYSSYSSKIVLATTKKKIK